MNKRIIQLKNIGILICSVFICYGMDVPKDAISSTVFNSLLNTSVDLPLALKAVPSYMISNENRIVVGASAGLYVIRYKNFLEDKNSILQVNSIDTENAYVQKIMPMPSSDACFIFLTNKGIRFLDVHDKLNTEFQGLSFTSLRVSSTALDPFYIKDCWCSPQANYLIFSYAGRERSLGIFGVNLDNNNVKFITQVGCSIRGSGFLDKETFLLEHKDKVGERKKIYIKVPANSIQTGEFDADCDYSNIYPGCGALTQKKDAISKEYLCFSRIANACYALRDPFTKEDKLLVPFSFTMIRSGTVSNNNSVISFAVITESTRNDHNTEIAAILNCNNKEIKVFEDARRTSNIAGNIFAFVDKKGKVFFKEVNF